jgi:hypothetical protein
LSRDRNAYSCRSAELPVAECSPQVPAGHRSEGAPSFPETLDVEALAIDVRDGALQSYVAKRKHIGFRRTMMRNTDMVQGPIPLMPVKASSHGWPCCTLARISSDLCRIVTQHWARRSGSPIARRLATFGRETGDGATMSGCADLTWRARRHATWVEICRAKTIRTRPQIGSSVGRDGQRVGCEAISRAIVESRADSRPPAPED